MMPVVAPNRRASGRAEIRCQDQASKVRYLR